MHWTPAAHGAGRLRRRARHPLERDQERRHVEAAPEVDLGDPRLELVAVPLYETADGGDPGAVSMGKLGRRQDGLDGLLFGGVDEPARIDDDEGSVLRRGGSMPARPQAPGERLRVGLVLGTAEGLDEEAGRSCLSGSL
jgi:hypothetical protein